MRFDGALTLHPDLQEIMQRFAQYSIVQVFVGVRDFGETREGTGELSGRKLERRGRVPRGLRSELKFLREASARVRLAITFRRCWY
jgi:hypothetical protein